MVWVNTTDEVPFMPKSPFEMKKGHQVIKFRADKFVPSSVHDEDGRDDPYGRSVMPIMHALSRGELRAYIQLDSGYLPIPKSMWAPDENGSWPVGWLIGQMDPIPFGDEAERIIEFPYVGASVLFLESEYKKWANSPNGKPRQAIDQPGYVSEQNIRTWLTTVDTNQFKQAELLAAAQKWFSPHIVRPYHVKKARREIEPGNRKSGPKSGSRAIPD